MKAKVKFDKDSLISFFTENGEKIVFGVVVLVFFMFVWSAITCERYKKTPEDLEKVVGAATKHIQEADSSIKVKIPDYVKIIKAINKPIPAESYQVVTTWRPPIFPPLRKRSQPSLERVENLMATSGHGRFSNSGGGGALIDNEIPEGKRWIVLTGLLNMEKIKKEYKDTFEDVAFRQQTDYPEFYSEFCSFYVQRAEVTDENLDQLEWKEIYTDINQYLTEHVGIQGSAPSPQSEKTDPTCIEPAIICPLPPRVDRDWAEEVLHPPEISMIDPMAENRMFEGTPGGPETYDMTPTDGGPPGVGGLPPGIGTRQPRGNAVATNFVPEKSSPYVLFRFFDFNVEPGKKYRYHVKLYFKNPNFGVEERYLDPGLAKLMQDKEQWQNYIATEWSEPSKVVHMPFDDSLLLTEVTRSNVVDAEPSATITAIHWDYMKGIEIFDKIEGISRGMVVNLFDRNVPTDEPETPEPPEDRRRRRVPRRPRPPQREPEVEREKVNYVTGMLVLDLKGGESLPGRAGLRKPSSMLLFSPSGAMTVRSSVTDKEEREKLEETKEGGVPFRRGRRPPTGRNMMMDY